MSFRLWAQVVCAFVVATFVSIDAHAMAGENPSSNGRPSEDSRGYLNPKYEHGMHVILTGVGWPVYFEGEGGASVAVIVDGDVLQFDLGMKAMERLRESEIHPRRIDHLFFTHYHIDHIADFPLYLALYASDTQTVFHGPTGLRDMIAGVNSYMAWHLRERAANLNVSEADVRLIVPTETISENGVVLETESYTVVAMKVPHAKASGHESLAYRIDSRYGSVVISGDTAPSMNIVELAQDTDLLIHEAHYSESFQKRETDTFEDGLHEHGQAFGHTTPEEVGKVAAAANAKKLVIYHRPPFISDPLLRRHASRMSPFLEERMGPDQEAAFLDAIAEDYSGPIIIGDPLMTFEFGN